MMSGKRVIVTGATGFIGSNLVRRLLTEGALVHVFVRSSSDHTRIKDVAGSVTLHEVDLTDLEAVKRTLDLIQPEGVFHLAALNQRYGFVPTSRDLLEGNTLVTMNLMDAMNSFGYTFFVNTGTFSEVGPKENALKESDVCEPTEMYSISKLTTTLYAQALGRNQKKPIVTVRIFTPYGQFMQKGKIVTQLIEGALLQKEIKLSHESVTRDFIHIDDLVDLYICVAENAHTYHGEIFNGGTGIATGLGELVKMVENYTGKKIPVVWSNQLATYDHSVWQADTTKVREKIGWTPKVSLEDGIKKSVDWFLEHQDYWNEQQRI